MPFTTEICQYSESRLHSLNRLCGEPTENIEKFSFMAVYHAVSYSILMFKIYILVKTDCYNNF